jgi:hypothetical protein
MDFHSVSFAGAYRAVRFENPVCSQPPGAIPAVAKVTTFGTPKTQDMCDAAASHNSVGMCSFRECAIGNGF